MASDSVFDRSTRFLVFDLGDPFAKVLEHMHDRLHFDYVVLRKTEQKSGKPKFFILGGENFFQSIDIPNIASLSRDINLNFTLNQVYGTQIDKIIPVHTIQGRLKGAQRRGLSQVFKNWTPVLELRDDEPVSVLD